MLKILIASAIVLVALAGNIEAQDTPEPTPEPAPTAPKKNKKVIKINRATINEVESTGGNTVILAGAGATTVRSINQLLNGLDQELEDAIDNAISNDPTTVVTGNLQDKINQLVDNANGD